MSIIKLKNNKTKVIIDELDFKDLIREELGADAEDEFDTIILGKIENLQVQADYTKQKINTDLEAYEGELEQNRNSLLDIRDIIEKLQEYIEDNTIAKKHKDKILKDIRQIEIEINNCI